MKSSVSASHNSEVKTKQTKNKQQRGSEMFITQSDLEAAHAVCVCGTELRPRWPVAAACCALSSHHHWCVSLFMFPCLHFSQRRRCMLNVLLSVYAQKSRQPTAHNYFLYLPGSQARQHCCCRCLNIVGFIKSSRCRHVPGLLKREVHSAQCK